ncbi:metallophosphoesterase family protein [Mycoplasmopsis adleri]|uniref:metallophosphoesterase family protein n=1 Tax=Mycoplasmopsis adleri TaxID=51362 RepID=UPI0038738731
MKIIVLSDIHRNKMLAEKILKNEDYDLAISLGDTELSDAWVDANFNYAIRGNNDFDSELPDFKTFDILNKKVYITHGHLLGSYSDLMSEERMKELTKEIDADLILYGHSHCAKLFIDETKNGKTKYIINPGSAGLPFISRNKNLNSDPSYCLIEISEKFGKIWNILFKTMTL